MLGCLIEKQAADPDIDALSLDDVRFSCNQTGRQELVAFDDRTVDDALLALKSKGLARFVAPARSVGPVRYRHRADERWRLSPAELVVLAALLLGGPQTLDEVVAAVRGRAELDTSIDVEEALDALAGRTPDPFATRIAAPSWGGEALWAEVLTGRPSPEELHHSYERRELREQREQRAEPRLPDTLPLGPSNSTSTGATTSTTSPPSAGPKPSAVASKAAPGLAEIADRLSSIERRLAGIEAALAALRGTQESTRAIR